MQEGWNLTKVLYKNARTKSIICLVFLTLILVANRNEKVNSKQIPEPYDPELFDIKAYNPPPPISLEPLANGDDPINVTNNTGFVALGCPGDGTINNPCNITGYTITNSTTILIRIQNTDAHFVINNCTLNGVNGTYIGILFFNVTNAIIQNNTIKSCIRGIYTDVSDNLNILHNIVTNSSASGTYLRLSHNSMIINNTISENYHGINNFISDNNTITNNTCFKNTFDGIRCYNSTNVTFHNNYLYDNDGSGLFIHQMNFYLNITNNRIYNVTTGISLIYSNNTNISNNEIIKTQTGIELSSSNNTNISNNEIINALSCIYDQHISHCNIVNNNLSDGLFGIVGNNQWTIQKINNNTIEGNNIRLCNYGIYFMGSLIPIYNTTITSNHLMDNVYDIFIEQSHTISIINNTLDSSQYGVYLYLGSNFTTVKWNIFLKHTINHIIDDGNFNTIQNNFWDDWKKPDDDIDGFIDNPYPIAGTASNEDPYPLSLFYGIDSDGDNLSDLFEDIYHTNPNDSDTDDDLMPDGWEVMNSLNPLTDDASADADSDSLTNYNEFLQGTDPNDSDSDDDLMPDDWEVNSGTDPLTDDGTADPDSDNLSNYEEYLADTDPFDSDSDDDLILDGEEVILGIDGYITDPNDSDSDDDLMPDGWEVANSCDPTIDDALEDADSDELSNYDEYVEGTDPNDSDTDNDLMPDGWEVDNNLDPLVDDANNDPDSDDLENYDEYLGGTDPWVADTDGDGINDGEEVVEGTDGFITDPLDDDSDDDGIIDGEEVIEGTDGFITDPNNSDSDNDGVDDSTEIDEGHDPTNANDFPLDVILTSPEGIVALSVTGAVTVIGSVIVIIGRFLQVRGLRIPTRKPPTAKPRYDDVSPGDPSYDKLPPPRPPTDQPSAKRLDPEEEIPDKTSDIREDSLMDMEGMINDVIIDLLDEFKKTITCPKCQTKAIGPYCYLCGTIVKKDDDVLKEIKSQKEN